MKIQRKRLITAGGTLLCALGIGYFMQSAAQSPVQTKPETVAIAGLIATKTEADTGPTLNTPRANESSKAPEIKLDDVVLTSAVPAKPELSTKAPEPFISASLGHSSDIPLRESEGETNLVCGHTLSATAIDFAMVQLTLDAPCLINEQFTLHHNGLTISEVTNGQGIAEFTAPALEENAVFIAAFPNGEGSVATVKVPTFNEFDRAVVQWRGTSGIQLHAFEFGADYGGEGHVSATTTLTRNQRLGGEVSRFGSDDLVDALVAEVYTFPTGATALSGDVILSVEVEVTPANCGRDIKAQSIQKKVDGSLQIQDLLLAVPNCNAIGDFLVLKNLLNDLKIAAK